jgi:hypothetical protein
LHIILTKKTVEELSKFHSVPAFSTHLFYSRQPDTELSASAQSVVYAQPANIPLIIKGL